jgi:hypothetical protein
MFTALSLYTAVQTPFKTCDFTRPFTDKILSPSSNIFSFIETSPFGKKKVAFGYRKDMHVTNELRLSEGYGVYMIIIYKNS